MNDLFKAKTLNDTVFGTGIELSGFGILYTEFSERYKEEKRIESEVYLYTEYNGIVKVDEDSIREFTGIYEEDYFREKGKYPNRPIYNGDNVAFVNDSLEIFHYGKIYRKKGSYMFDDKLTGKLIRLSDSYLNADYNNLYLIIIDKYE
ncbi:TPA: hypothetical protein I1663_000497 [Staphylococcus pseudintermedius]|uniref:hypothetical protein n=1 Tax=Staphylococcus pseudintermedius TaxID=283734 RepID=UPI00296D324C|nr:hypothetical protein [Staphylococcus pseudintermedius]HAR6088356.1 hypothetical protein [Staphylococcus pseudintermedius]